MGSAHNVELGSMDKRSARRLKPGAVVLYNEGSSRGLPTWWGRLRRVSENGGCLIEPFSRHWRESAPEPANHLARKELGFDPRPLPWH
jgi:hypothetical protein